MSHNLVNEENSVKFPGVSMNPNRIRLSIKYHSFRSNLSLIRIDDNNSHEPPHLKQKLRDVPS